MSRHLRLADWEAVLTYAEEIAKKAVEDFGIKVVAIPYTMYDGARGVKLAVYDSRGNLFKELYSGINDTVCEYKRALDKAYLTIGAL